MNIPIRDEKGLQIIRLALIGAGEGCKEAGFGGKAGGGEELL